jgi:hypothetical protein
MQKVNEAQEQSRAKDWRCYEQRGEARGTPRFSIIPAKLSCYAANVSPFLPSL